MFYLLNYCCSSAIVESPTSDDVSEVGSAIVVSSLTSEGIVSIISVATTCASTSTTSTFPPSRSITIAASESETITPAASISRSTASTEPLWPRTKNLITSA